MLNVNINPLFHLTTIAAQWSGSKHKDQYMTVVAWAICDYIKLLTGKDALDAIGGFPHSRFSIGIQSEEVAVVDDMPQTIHGPRIVSIDGDDITGLPNGETIELTSSQQSMLISIIRAAVWHGEGVGRPVRIEHRHGLTTFWIDRSGHVSIYSNKNNVNYQTSYKLSDEEMDVSSIGLAGEWLDRYTMRSGFESSYTALRAIAGWMLYYLMPETDQQQLGSVSQWAQVTLRSSPQYSIKRDGNQYSIRMFAFNHVMIDIPLVPLSPFQADSVQLVLLSLLGKVDEHAAKTIDELGTRWKLKPAANRKSIIILSLPDKDAVVEETDASV